VNINPLSANIVGLLSEEPISVQKTPEIAPSGTFSNILTEAFDTARATDTTDKTSAIALLTGQTDDMSGLLLDAQKAEIALNLALQIRNKVVDAYNDILRMQV
jgi:flagellar hook-basal body complex protein FliE